MKKQATRRSIDLEKESQFMTTTSKSKKYLGGEKISVVTSSAEGRVFDSRPGQTKDIIIDICCFSDKHAAFRSKSKDCLAQSQNIVCG